MKNIEHYRSFDHGLAYVTGVSDLNPSAPRYMKRPHSHSADFDKFYQETMDMFKKLMHTNSTMLAVPGPGRVMMDVAMNSFLEPGDKLLLIDNSYWGRYPSLMAKNYGIEIVHLSLPPEEPVDPQKVEDKLNEIDGPVRAAHIIHVCTETGITNPIKHVGKILKEKSPDTIYIVDSCTAFAGNPLRLDDWNIDVDYFLSHKGFNGPSGLAYMAINDKAMDFVNKRKTVPRSWYTSVSTWKDIYSEYVEDGRHCKESFPEVILHANRAKLDLIDQMGEETYLKKYDLASKAVRMGLRKMTDPENSLLVPGPECKNCPGCDAPDPNLTDIGKGRFCSQTNVGLSYPKGTDWKKIKKTLEERYWITCPHRGFTDERQEGRKGGGYFLSSNGMRVGLINDRQHYPRNILALITALQYSFIEGNIKEVRKGKAIEATNEVLKEMETELNWSYYGY